jgi:hypothetical protein
MARLAATCLASLLLYLAVFGLWLDRPLSTGFLRQQIEYRLARAASLEGPKLVILAGSGAAYSLRCEVMEPIAGIPCVNGGVAVGIGLDYLFARWQPLLHPGDTVYLPLEEAQYVRTRAATLAGPDAAILLRHDRATLAALRPDRWAAAALAASPRDAVMSVIETALVAAGFHDPRAAVTGGSNAWGDHAGHTAARGAANQPYLLAANPAHPTAAAILAGDGTAELRGFLAWARSHQVRVIGGLPVGFADSPLAPGAADAIRDVFTGGGAAWLALPNRHPRTDFFDTPDHLHEAAQIAHARVVAQALRPQLASRR